MPKRSRNNEIFLSIISIATSLLLINHAAAFVKESLHSHLHRRYIPRCLFMSTSSAPKTAVVFQKVVRPSRDQPPALFISQLVEYLQDKFHLPPKLPMLYETVETSNDLNAVVSWHSPLSTSPEDTLLTVEVIGIHVDDDEAKRSPEMAMVAVHKIIADSKSDKSRVTSNLFDDSEKKILRSLDRGLDRFSAGEIKGFKATEFPTPSKWQTVTREEVENDHDYNVLSEGSISNSTFEAQATKAAMEIQMQNEHSKADNKDTQQFSKRELTGKDYAVEAARKVAASKVGVEDYAITAAKSVVKDKGLSQNKEINKADDSHREPKAKSRPNIKVTKPHLGSNVWRISSPKTRKAKLDQKKQREQKEATSNFNEEKITTPNTVAPSGASVDFVDSIETSRGSAERDPKSNLIIDANVVPDTKSEVSSSNNLETKNSNRTLNLKVVDEKNQIDEMSNDPEAGRAKEAQRIMNEITENSQDMTSEELLKAVLKFGEEKKEEESAGSGFVTGAFQKAKELLKEQKKRRELHFQEASKFEIPVESSNASEESNDITESVEDELKRIFKAGEHFAEKRMARTSSTMEGEMTKEQRERVDELIASEKTVSSHARSLDEELAELEVRVNRNPAEDMDGPHKNPQFDILSGPEVYNPNVDPESTVNWPGALPGTKSVRLPDELNEAVKQAEFAASVITKMREEKEEGQGDQVVKYYVGERQLTNVEVQNLRSVVEEAVQLGIINDPIVLLEERSRLEVVVRELWDQPEERFREILDNYRDLLLSDNFVSLLKERLVAMADRDLKERRKADGDPDKLDKHHEREREILGHLIVFAQLLLKEVRALGAELEAQQVEVIRSICNVAMNPNYQTEEETARALTDAVRDMRPMFDDVFVAYIKFAVMEEEGRLARAGVLDDPEHNEWLMVLKIIQQGVYSEIAVGINRYIEHIWYVLRMQTPQQRRDLLSEFIDKLPSLDVRPFVHVVDNIASSLGDAVKGDIEPTVLGEMANKILQLHRDVHELLPKDRIDNMAKDADEWAARQKQRLLEQRNMTKKRLEQQDKHLTSDVLKRATEVERYD